MSDQTEFTPAVEGVSTDVQEAAVITDEAEGLEKTDETQADKVAKDPVKSLTRRVDRLTAQKYQIQAERDFYANRIAELERAQTPKPASDESNFNLDVDGIVRYAKNHFEQEQQHKQLESRISQIMADGRKLTPNFDTLTRALNDAAGSLGDNTGKPKPFVEAILESNQAAQLIAHLGEHDDLAAEIASLPKTQQIKRIALLEHELKQSKPKVSAAAKPLEPVKTSGTTAGPDPSDTEAWIKWRNKQMKGA